MLGPPKMEMESSRNCSHDHEANVVASVFVSTARIAEPDDNA
jgi:hypothetical protein